MEPTARTTKPRNPTSNEGVCKTLYVDERKVAAVAATMPSDDVVTDIADKFGAFCDPTRIRILYALSREELCVCDLSRLIQRSMPATSHQLQLLRRMRLVKYRMEGKLAYYTLSSPWARRIVADAIRRSDSDTMR